MLSGTSRRLLGDGLRAILNVPRPRTKRKMRCFLGMAGQCRPEVPDLCQSGDLSRIVSNSQGDCLGSTKRFAECVPNGWMDDT